MPSFDSRTTTRFPTNVWRHAYPPDFLAEVCRRITPVCGRLNREITHATCNGDSLEFCWRDFARTMLGLFKSMVTHIEQTPQLMECLNAPLIVPPPTTCPTNLAQLGGVIADFVEAFMGAGRDLDYWDRLDAAIKQLLIFGRLLNKFKF